MGLLDGHVIDVVQVKLVSLRDVFDELLLFDELLELSEEYSAVDLIDDGEARDTLGLVLAAIARAKRLISEHLLRAQN